MDAAVRRWMPGTLPRVALCLCLSGLALPALAQDRDAPARRYTPPARIAWELTVLTNGQETDKLSGNTAVGQSATVTRHWQVSHPVGCEGAQTQPVTFSRTVTLSPLGVDSHQVIGFSVDTEETVDDDAPQTVRSDGCALPSAPRTITAHHPEWDIASGQSDTWTILPRHPLLTYRLSAHVATAGAAASAVSATGSAAPAASTTGASGAEASRTDGTASSAAPAASTASSAALAASAALAPSANALPSRAASTPAVR